MSSETCSYCSKTYSSHAKLLMHIELAPQKGGRNAEIHPKLNAADTPGGKWVHVLLKLKGDMPALRLRPKKFPYQLRPIIGRKLMGRLQQ